MTRKHLFDAVKKSQGFKTDRDLADGLGCVKSFVSMMRSGVKHISPGVMDSIRGFGFTDDQINILIGLADGQPEPVLAVPGAVAPVQHEPDVLPDAPGIAEAGARAADDPAPAVCEGAEGGREGGGEHADRGSESGAGAAPGIPEVEAGANTPARTRRKRGTAEGTVLREGAIYYPLKHSKHKFRRITGLTQNGKAKYVLYSIGSDTVHVCERVTFLRWMDPSRIGEEALAMEDLS